jgi:hypothetical protein
MKKFFFRAAVDPFDQPIKVVEPNKLHTSAIEIVFRNGRNVRKRKTIKMIMS